VITREEMTSLIWLRWHWETHFKITYEDGVWQALPSYAPDEILSADTPMRLRDAMKNHFAVAQVNRRP
jgi:hypothetical protein